jgi:hypothetical protein
MISLNSVSPARLYSAAAEKLPPQRLTILFGLAVLGAVYYLYRRLNPSLHDFCKQAFEKGEYKKIAQYCVEEFSRFDRRNVPLDSPLNIVPYFWRNAGDLKTGNYCRVIDSCHKVSKCKMNDQLKPQFLLQEMEAHLGLDQPVTAKETFEKNKELLTKQSKLLGQAYYLLGLAYKGTGDNSEVEKFCDEALKQISKQDLELKVKLLVLKSLALLDKEKYLEAAEIGYSVLRLFYPNTSKVSKETLGILYFSLALSEYAQNKDGQGLFDFEQALKNIEKDDQYLRNLLTFHCRYVCAKFAKTYTDAQTSLREAEEAYKACKGASDDYRSRSELTRCIIRIIVSNLRIGDNLLSQLATRNKSLRLAT